MSTKKPETAAAGAVGGYLRVSLIVFPPECRAAEERAAFVDGLRQIRKAELCREAAAQGEAITEWYDDLGVSGRGEFYPKRVAFSRARRDAKEGRLRSLYARDLSRLFRNVVQQELWFAEMEDLGVTVHAQDLPFAADAATRRLLRQQMGIIHEYVSSRMGTQIRERTRTRLLGGLGVVITRHQWGLRYDSGRKAYDFDPDTADRVRLLFETYVACGGVAGHAAKRLNLLLAQGHPRATPTPTGKLWSGGLLLCQIRSSLYRRTLQYGDLLIPAPERVPAVVDPELVARADALLVPRTAFFAAVKAKKASGLKRFTYTGVLRCGYCGGPMRARPRTYGAGEEGTGWVSYQCNATSYNRGCSAQYLVQQRRLHRLVDRGIRRALEEAGRPPLGAPPGPAGRGPGDGPPDPEGAAHNLEGAAHNLEGAAHNLEGAAHFMADAPSQLSLASAHALREVLGRLDRKRDRYLELFASGLIQAPEELARHLARVAQERHTLQDPRTPERAVSAGATRPASAEEVAGLEADFLRVWPEDWARVLDAGKQGLLERLRASISVRILSHPTKNPGKTDRPRHNGGRLTLTLELPALGFAGMRALQLAETDEDLEDYWRWRGSFVGQGKAGFDANGKAGFDANGKAGFDANGKAGFDANGKAGFDANGKAGFDANGKAGFDADDTGAGAPAGEDGASPPPLRCRHCQSKRVTRSGREPRGTQRFLCRDCKRSFHRAEDDLGHSAAFRAGALAAYWGGASACTRSVATSVSATARWQSGVKKAKTLMPVTRAGRNPRNSSQESQEPGAARIRGREDQGPRGSGAARIRGREDQGVQERATPGRRTETKEPDGNQRTERQGIRCPKQT